MRTRSLVALTLVLSLAAVACAKSSTGTAGGGASTATSAAAPSPAASSDSGRYGSGYGSGSGGGQSSAAGSSALTVTQANLTFTPAEISVHQGDSITVEDTDSVPHTFTVEGTSIDVTNQAGQSQTVAIDLKPGTYSVICRFHVSMGMKATLVVA